MNGTARSDASSLSGYYDSHYGKRTELPRSSKVATLACVPAGKLRVLDIGCGTGLNSEALAKKGHSVIGIDISERAIEQYRARGFEGRVMNVEQRLDFADRYFDVVFASEVIEHLAMPEALAQEAYRVLRPGGKLVLSTPNSAFWLYRLLGLFGWTVAELQHPKHLQFFSRRSLEDLLRKCDFEIADALGRNMYLILPDVRGPARPVLRRLGFLDEPRYRTGSHFWHWSQISRFGNSLFADTLIYVLSKRADGSISS